MFYPSLFGLVARSIYLDAACSLCAMNCLQKKKIYFTLVCVLNICPLVHYFGYGGGEYGGFSSFTEQHFFKCIFGDAHNISAKSVGS